MERNNITSTLEVVEDDNGRWFFFCTICNTTKYLTDALKHKHFRKGIKKKIYSMYYTVKSIKLVWKHIQCAWYRDRL